MVHTINMRFEWDDAKARFNAAKHGVTFERAITAFDDPYGLIAPDEKHSMAGERREWLIGEPDHGMLVVVFTTRERAGSAGSSALDAPADGRGSVMKNTKEFPFEKARRVTPRELAAARKAIEERTGVPRQTRGRPPKAEAEKYLATTIRLHPRVLAWARREAAKRGVGYQTIINEVLLEKAG